MPWRHPLWTSIHGCGNNRSTERWKEMGSDGDHMTMCCWCDNSSHFSITPHVTGLLAWLLAWLLVYMHIYRQYRGKPYVALHDQAIPYDSTHSVHTSPVKPTESIVPTNLKCDYSRGWGNVHGKLSKKRYQWSENITVLLSIIIANIPRSQGSTYNNFRI